MNLSRIFPLLLIVLAHLLLLQVVNKSYFAQTRSAEIIPVFLYKPPVITKFTAAQQPNVTPPKKTPPLRQLKKVAARPELTESLKQSDLTPFPEAEIASPDLKPVAPPPVAITAPIPATKLAVTTLPPPSANYMLDVVRTEPGLANPYYGSGEIYWNHDDTNYTMHIKVGINLLFTSIRLYDIQSEGIIEDIGIKPVKVTETRRGKSANVTNFNYDSDTISFSASPAIVPLFDGAQDKATVFMQLASIGNADPSQFQEGKEITIQVAEEKEANPHQFVVTNQETLETKLGRLATWHIVRPPRPGSYTSRLDVWLAPEFDWLPVQIRNIEANGAITTQTIRQIKGTQ